MMLDASPYLSWGSLRDFDRRRHGGFTGYARNRIRASIREAILHHGRAWGTFGVVPAYL